MICALCEVKIQVSCSSGVAGKGPFPQRWRGGWRSPRSAGSGGWPVRQADNHSAKEREHQVPHASSPSCPLTPHLPAICYAPRYIFRLVEALDKSRLRMCGWPLKERPGHCPGRFANRTHTIHLSIGIELWQFITQYFS